MSDQQFQQFFMLHHHGVYRLLHRMCGVAEEAEDLLQESFVRLHDHWDEIDPEKRKSWLYQVATRQGLNRLRDEKRLQHRHEQASLHRQRSGQDQTNDDPLLKIAVQRALAAMPERQARLLMLYSTGLRHDELAEAMEVKPTSLSQLLHRAKKAFEQVYSTPPGSSGPLALDSSME